MLQANAAAQDAYALAGGSPTQDFDGLDPVLIDLKQAFFKALATAIMATDRPDADKKAALEALLPLTEADWPLGIPEFNEMAPCTFTARLSARLSVQVELEKLKRLDKEPPRR